MPVSLAEMPSMDDHRIGPGGQTFRDLKQAVVDTRAAFQAGLMRGQATPELMDAYDTAVRLLKAAYVRVGLPYRAP